MNDAEYAEMVANDRCIEDVTATVALEQNTFKQCSRKKQEGSLYCRQHGKGHPEEKSKI